MRNQLAQTLKAEGAAPSDLARLRGLFDTYSEYPYDDRRDLILAIARYVCGLTDVRPESDYSCYKAVVQALAPPERWGRWDERALDLIADLHEWNGYTPFFGWLGEQVLAKPKQPVFERVHAALVKRKTWKTDVDTVRDLIAHNSELMTKAETLTSMGRWLLARLDRQLEVALAEVKTSDFNDLARLLAAHRPKLFAAHWRELMPHDDYRKIWFFRDSLERDRRRFEREVVDAASKLTSGEAHSAASLIAEHFPGKYLDLIEQLCCSAVTDPLLHEEVLADARKWLGPRKTAVWAACGARIRDDTERLEVYAIIAKQDRKAALPFLVDGLVRKLDPDHTSRPVAASVYVTKIFKLLKGADLAPHRERIERALAKRDPKVRAELARAFGKAPLKTAALPPLNPRTGYRFEAYVAQVAKAATTALAKVKTIPQPVTRIHLAGNQGDFTISYLGVEGGRDTLELKLGRIATKIPSNGDECDLDELLAPLAKRHQLTPGDSSLPTWGSVYDVPASLLIHELLDAADAVKNALAERKIKFTRGCEIGVGDGDNFWQRSDGFERKTRASLARLPPEVASDLAALCFESPEKRRWLLS